MRSVRRRTLARWSHPLLWATALALLLLAARPLHAGDPEQARKLGAAAASLFQAEQYELALETLLKLREHTSTGRILYNIGRCHEELGHYGAALKAFDEYLESPDEAAVAAQARQKVEALEDKLYGRVEVQCQPPGAVVRAGELGEGPCPFARKRVTAGTYPLSVAAAKHQTHTQKLVVRIGKTAKLNVKLDLLPGVLDVSSQAPGGIAFLGGRKVGPLPLKGHKVPPGTYDLLVKTKHHDDWGLKVVVEPGQTAAIMAVPKPHPGKLAVSSTPPGAAVLLDGAERGRTPLTLEPIAAGEHTLRVVLEGRVPWEQAVRVAAGKTAKINAELASQTGALEISSRPKKAAVTLDGKPRGDTPTTLEGLAPGPHELLLTKAGYVEVGETVTVKAGETTRLKFQLAEAVGTLLVTSTPERATVRVDGKRVGKTPARVAKLAAGEHAVEVTLQHHEPWRQAAVIEVGKETQLDAELMGLPGTLLVSCPAGEGELLVDGRPAGKIGPQVRELPDMSAGEHQLVVRVPHHEPWIGVAVVPPGRSAEVQASPTPHPPGLSVKSEPPGARVLLGGKPIGTTPIDGLKVQAGQHALRVELAAHEPWTGEVETAPARPVLVEVTLEPLPAHLSVAVKPAGATVRAGDRALGKAPLERVALSPGKYTLGATAAGYQPWQEEVVLGPAEERTLAVKLERAPATLAVVTRPAGASVWLDGKLAGESPFEAKLPGRGEVELILRKPGYFSAPEYPALRWGETERIELAPKPLGTDWLAWGLGAGTGLAALAAGACAWKAQKSDSLAGSAYDDYLAATSAEQALRHKDEQLGHEDDRDAWQRGLYIATSVAVAVGAGWIWRLLTGPDEEDLVAAPTPAAE